MQADIARRVEQKALAATDATASPKMGASKQQKTCRDHVIIQTGQARYIQIFQTCLLAGPYQLANWTTLLQHAWITNQTCPEQLIHSPSLLVIVAVDVVLVAVSLASLTGFVAGYWHSCG
jgi:hypothetical protein